MSIEDIEKTIMQCYSTWGKTYYQDYYSEKAPYPPVHRNLVRKLIQEAKPRNLLDVGCGPASMLRELFELDLELFGFDLTPEMVQEAQRVFSEKGLPPGNIWQGSILKPSAFRCPGHSEPIQFDAVLCLGVLPHIPKEEEETAFRNIFQVIRPGGFAMIEARNQLFSLFTLNRFSYKFFLENLISIAQLKKEAGENLRVLEDALDEMKNHFRMDLPPLRIGKEGELGYDEVLARLHNPFELKDLMCRSGFSNVRICFFHYHCIPPMLSHFFPEFFLEQSLKMENPDDWRGYFMASAFFVVGTRA